MSSEMECKSPEQLGAQLASSMTDLDALKSSIIAGIDSKLSQKEENMWRRGLKEIKRLQSEQQEVMQVVSGMQEKQESLATENQQLRAALCDVTAKFEQVVNEMRQALRHMPMQAGNQHGQLSPSPSVASTAASDAASPLGSLLHAAELAQGRVHVIHLERAMKRYGQLPESFEESWVKLMAINEKARLVTELNSLIENRVELSTKVGDTSDKCRTLLAQYEDALRKLQKAALLVLETQKPGQAAQTPQDESFTEPTSASSKGNISMAMGLTPSWPTPCVEDAAETFSTPPRVLPSSEDQALLGDAIYWQGHYRPSPTFTAVANTSSAASGSMLASPPGIPVASSPAPAVLSLASALTAAPMGYPAAGAATSPMSKNGGFKQLQLAECLEDPTTPANLQQQPSTPYQFATPAQGNLKVELLKEPGFTTLGMEVNEEGTAIRVQSIDEHGLVARYNRTQGSQSSTVHVGDLIVEVNGVCADPSGMLQQCKTQELLLLTVARGNSSAVSSPPSPLGANAPNSLDSLQGLAQGCSLDGGEMDRVLAEVASFKEVAAPPASWGRLRPEARVFVPSSAQASESTPLAGSLDLDAQVAKEPEDASAPVADGALARLLFP